MPEHGLGRLVNHDPRSRAFSVAPLLATLPPFPTVPWWRTGVFDQGSESSCTAQAECGTIITSPWRMLIPRKRHATDPPNAIDKCYDPRFRYGLYRSAQTLDPWPGDEATEPRYEGSSGLAAAKAAKQLGLVPASWEYRWGFSVSDTINAHRLGPVSNGTVWLNSMFTVDKLGYLVVDPHSGEAGGHQWETLQYLPDDHAVLMINSWGTSWGRNGRAKIHEDDYEWLLAQDGDAHVWVPA